MPGKLWIVPIGKPEERFRSARRVCKADKCSSDLPYRRTGKECRKGRTKEGRSDRPEERLALHRADYESFQFERRTFNVSRGALAAPREQTHKRSLLDIMQSRLRIMLNQSPKGAAGEVLWKRCTFISFHVDSF